MPSKSIRNKMSAIYCHARTEHISLTLRLDREERSVERRCIRIELGLEPMICPQMLMSLRDIMTGYFLRSGCT
jgi:hypothetical protein